MPIKAIIYDIEIDILKIHYDPIILKIKKDLHLSLSTIKNIFFSSQFYFFTIGKISFETFIETAFNDFMLDFSYISKLEKKYSKSFNYFQTKKDNLLVFQDLFKVNIYFSGDIDSTIASSLIKKDYSLNKITYFSSKLNALKQESHFVENLLSYIDYDISEILIIDDNLDVLLNAKEKGLMTLFYDGKRDLYELLKFIFMNYKE